MESLPHDVPVCLFAELVANHTELGSWSDISVAWIGPDMRQLGPAAIDPDIGFGGNPTSPDGWDHKMYWGAEMTMRPPVAGTYTIQLRIIPREGEPGLPYDLPFNVKIGEVPR